MATITIVGLGLIGGSLGLALKAAKPTGIEIVGHDKDRTRATKAQRLGAIDRAEGRLDKAVQDAAMVILATPVLAIRRVMEEMAPYLPENCIVTDTGSTKAAILAWAQELLPPTVHFVGGHPIAGKEQSGIDAAQADLFRDKPYCVIPLPDTHEQAVRAVVGMAELVGARPMYMDARDHDQFLAAVSHMPMILSTALFTLARSSASWKDISAVAGPAFRDLTRLASGDPEMDHDICLTNSEGIIHWLDRYIEELRRYRTLIVDDQEKLFETFMRAQLERDTFIEARPAERGPAVEVPSSGEFMMGLLFSERLVRRTKAVMQELGRLGGPGAPPEDRGRRR